MSLTWEPYSTPSTTDEIQNAVVSFSARHKLPDAYEGDANISFDVQFNCPPGISQVDMLDLLTPIHDALVSNGWTDVTVAQSARVSRTAS